MKKGRRRLMAWMLCLVVALTDAGSMGLLVMASESVQETTTVVSSSDAVDNESGLDNEVRADDISPDAGEGNSTVKEGGTNNSTISGEKDIISNDGMTSLVEENEINTDFDFSKTGSDVEYESSPAEKDDEDQAGNENQEEGSVPEKIQNLDEDKTVSNENNEKEIDEIEPVMAETVEDEEQKEDVKITASQANNSVTDSGKCGDNLMWRLEDGTLTISGTGEMNTYSASAGITTAPWGKYHNTDAMKSLIIETGITSISNYAFCGLNELKGELVIPDSIRNIRDHAFQGCSGFSGKLVLPEQITVISSSAFENCWGFSGDLVIPDNVYNIGMNAFNGCSGFDGNLKIPPRVNYIGDNAFKGCIGLKGEITIPDKVTVIHEGIFNGCGGLKGNLIIPDNVTSIGQDAFNGCKGLNGSLIIPDDVTSIGDRAFYECSGFDGELKLSNCVTRIGNKAFYACHGLNGSLLIPGTVEYIGTSAFEYCRGFDGSLTISNGVTRICDHAFAYCQGFTGRLIIPDSLTSIWGFVFKGCSGFSGDLIIPDSVTSISSGAFADCSGLGMNLMIPDSVTSIEDTAFGGCYDIKNIIFRGDAPKFTYNSFKNVTANVYYLSSKAGWDSGIINKDYGGTLTWIQYTDDYADYEMQIYSQFTSCTIGIGQSFGLRPLMVKNEESLKDERGYSFIIANTDILEIVDTKYDEYGPIIELKGKSAGTTTLKIIHVASGKNKVINLTVLEEMKIYNISDLLNFEKDHGIFNAEIFLDSFRAEKQGKGYNITFDAYNGLSHAAAVEVYNQEGELIRIKKIDKHKKHETSIKEVGISFADLIVTTFSGNLDSFKEPLYSQRTSIDIYVPDGGYFIISNNMQESIGTYIYNAIDICFFAYSEIAKLTDSSEETLEKVTKTAQEDIAKRFTSELLKAEKEKFVDKYQKEVFKTLEKEIGKTAIADIMGNFTDDAVQIFDYYDFNLNKLFVDTAADCGISIAEDTLQKLGGAPGKTLEALFDMNKYLNRCRQVVDIYKTQDISEVKIFVKGDNDYLVSEGVIVQDKAGQSLADNELVVVDVTDDETSLYILEKFSGSSEKIRIMDITMYRDKQEVQPNGVIRVKIPLPLNYDPERAKVFRVEKDGTVTDMEVIYSDGYLVFETEHLSKYVLAEMMSAEFVYSIDFSGNGAEKGEMESLKGCKRDVEYLLPENTYERSGYNFVGWNTKPDGTGDTYVNRAVIMNLASGEEDNVILYAQWQKIQGSITTDIDEVLPEDIPTSGIIPSGLWIATINDYFYTGKPIKPEAHVYDSRTRLKKGQDYTVTYKNNIKANDSSASKNAPTIIVKGKGNYAGTETATFSIQHINLGDSEIICEDITTAYTGKVQKVLPVICYQGKKLSINKDFTVSYPDLIRGVTEAYCAPGTYDILLSAKESGNYTGTRTVKFVITKNILLSQASVKKIPNKPYTGNVIEPELEVVFRNTTLVKDTDYTVTYKNNKVAGKATVILTGIGDYAGTKKVTFNITGIPLKKATVSRIPVQMYNGLEQKPNVSLTVNGVLLKDGTDYQITYSNNLNAGTGTVTIKGINAYTGSIKKTFRINAYDLKEDTANKIGGLQTEITSKYLKGGSKPKIELTYAGKKLTEGTDYTLSYKNNKALTEAGTRKLPTITVKGKGNFKGSISKTFTIVGKALDDKEFPVTLRVADKSFIDKAGNYISKPILIDSDGKKLVSGKDYDKNVIYERVNGTRLDKTDELIIGDKVKVKVKGNGAYSGELEALYEIKSEDFGKAKITIASQPYTGKEITLDQDDIAVKFNGSNLRFGTDYDIVDGSYVNNLKKGSAEVTIAGKGNYGGMKTVKFRIVSKKFEWFWRMFG